MPKFLVLTPGVFDKGGISRYMRFQIKALRDHFDEKSINVLSLVGRQIGDFEDPFEVNWCGPVPLTKFSRVYFSSVALYYAIRNNPDIILCGHVNMGPLALLVSKIISARLVLNIYGRELWSGLSKIRKISLRNADLIISDCYNSAQWITKNNIVKREPFVIWDCVDIDRFCPGSLNWKVLEKYNIRDTGRFRLMFLGRINQDTRYKGTERLLELLSKLPSNLYEVIICGKGNDISYLKQKAKELGIYERVIFTGPIDEKDLPMVYHAADVFYLVSEVGYGKGEGLPLSPIEAMACGVPIIVGNQDGSKEIIDGGGGLCCPPDDYQIQLHYIQRLKNEKTFIKQNV